MYNKVTIIGHLTCDATLRYTPGGIGVSDFGIAANYKYKDTEETLFLGCVLLGKIAESLTQYLTKGILVYLEGRLREEKWEKDGRTNKKMMVVVQTVKLLGNKVKPTQTTQAAQTTFFPSKEESDLEPF
ncbi:single-stranded DNA-binding protein [Patescibacteria group bacterium]|nr:single-stranded DNA-binding protein [Patescibacteria group bacterium]